MNKVYRKSHEYILGSGICKSKKQIRRQMIRISAHTGTYWTLKGQCHEMEFSLKI